VDYEEAKARYAELVATIHDVQLKGAKMPYTSTSGNMFSYLRENGVALRLPADVRDEFVAKYRTTLYHAYGIVQKEYVTVPAELLETTDELAPYFRVSYDYARSLKPKPTRRAPKS
jgi:TfoX/Sxy family transcriptional regulator of competence genes